MSNQLFAERVHSDKTGHNVNLTFDLHLEVHSSIVNCKLTLFQTTILFYSSKLKEFTDDIFKSHENGRKFFHRVENTAGKGEIALYEQLLLFPQCFQKIWTAYTYKRWLV